MRVPRCLREVFDAPEFESHDIWEGFDIPEFESHDICEVFEEFEPGTRVPRYLRGCRREKTKTSPCLHARGTPLPCYLRPDVRYHAICGVFQAPRCPLPCYLRCFQAPRCPLPCYLRCFRAPRRPSPCYLRCFQAPRCLLPCYLRCFQAPRCPLPCYLRCFSSAQMSVTMICAVFSCAQMSVTMLFAVFSCAQMSATMLFAVFFGRPDVRYHAMCGVFRRPGRPRRTTSVLQKVDFPATEAPRVRGVLRLYYKSRLSSHGSSGCPRRTTFVLQKSIFQPRKLCVSAAYYVCTTKVDFPATEAPGVPGVLHVCTTKSRLSSHGSSACPRRTAFVLQKVDFPATEAPGVPGALYVCTTKVDFPATEAPRVRGVLRLYYKKSTFQPRKLRVSAAYYVCTTKVDFPATEAPGVPGVLYVCTTKVDFPATEAPRVRGVLRLYYQSRLSSHGSSACPRRTTFVLQKSIFQPRKSPAYYVCTTQVDKKNAKHYGFRTATTRKPAEGLRLHVKKRKNTTVLAPRQRRNPQRGYFCMSQNAKARRFWHRANAETR